ncbi:MAG: Gldg family protein [Beggiatoa sp.]|nr:Gldg family protein [Beggiatoa sp.]
MTRRSLSRGGLLLAVGLFLAVNILAGETMTAWRVDLTENRLFTLSKGTRNILKDLDEPIALRFFYSTKLFQGIPTLQSHGNRIRDLLDEYVAEAGGKLTLTVIDPEPFSEAEDEAVANGVNQLPVSGSGDRGYLGLVGTNSADDRAVLPFLSPEKEQSLEYEVTKLVYNLAHPKKRVIGLITTLPIMGDPMRMGGGERGGPSALATMLREAFEIRELGTEVESIDKDIDTLVVVHPKALSEATRYAIDQFVLKGGKAMVFVDPYAEEDRSTPDPHNPAALPKVDSDLPDLFERWGLKLVKDKLAADLEAAIRVTYSGPSGPRQIEYLPWLRLREANLNRRDFVTNELGQLNVGSAGALEPVKDAKTEFTPLLSTGKKAMLMDRDAVMFSRDPAALMQGFKPGDRSLVLAARLSGVVKTAFPQGKPKKDEDKNSEDDNAKAADPVDKDFITESKGPVNIIVVGDTDLLADRFWVQMQDFLGLNVPQAIADNANFVINALDNLGGNDDLISLRSRGEYARPFTKVASIQRDAELRLRDRERALQDKLKDTEKKIQDLQREKGEGSTLLLSAEQKSEIESFRGEQIKTRKELRAVQHDLRQNIERLGDWLRFINIALIPILIGLCAALAGVWRTRRTTA